MAKFKVGDLVYASRHEHKDWQYEVLMTGLIRPVSHDEGVLVKCTKKPKGALSAHVGHSVILSPVNLELLPKKHKITVLVYKNGQLGKPHSITDYPEETFRQHYPHYTVLNVTELEVELSE